MFWGALVCLLILSQGLTVKPAGFKLSLYFSLASHLQLSWMLASAIPGSAFGKQTYLSYTLLHGSHHPLSNPTALIFSSTSTYTQEREKQMHSHKCVECDALLIAIEWILVWSEFQRVKFQTTGEQWIGCQAHGILFALLNALWTLTNLQMLVLWDWWYSLQGYRKEERRLWKHTGE